MALQYNSGKTSTQNVNISGGVTNFPVPGTGQSIVVAQYIAVANGATIYTVTAGKTFYLMGWFHWNGAASVAQLSGSVACRTAAGIEQGGMCAGGCPMSSHAGSSTITITTGQAGNTGSIWGFEQ